MRKYLPLAIAVSVLAGNIRANTVPQEIANSVAANFTAEQLSGANVRLALFYTQNGTTIAGQPASPLFYIYNVTTSQTQNSPVGQSGFVIVSADDAVSPILAYSFEGNFVLPQPGTNVDYWMKKVGREISYLIGNNLKATPRVAAEWETYKQAPYMHRAHRAQSLPHVPPLCQSTWNQSPYYNAWCPGGSVTGCVATAMAQIMRYWSYPAHGIGSSFYTETSPQNYGLLQANYDTSNYVWSNMPLNLTSNNSRVAELNYDCGVSVNMSYSPSESGAWVITADSRICAQNSYVKYFGYDARTIQGLKRKNFSDSLWMLMIKNELNNSRLVQYVGWDSVNGGHTWVCDGYDTLSNLHMNWGWGGYDNGYFKLDTLNPNPYFFSKGEEILIGIEPPPVRAYFTAVPVSGCAGMNVAFTDRSLVYDQLAPVTNWKWTFAGGNPSTSSAQNPTVVYNSPGVYPVTLIVTNVHGTDTLTMNSYISADSINALPFTQNFEGTFPPAQWAINNPWAHATTWTQYAGTGGYGNSSHCMIYNNCMGGKAGQHDRIYTPAYNFSSITNPAIYFDVAYTPYNNIYSDTLAVYYSLDCGNTFTRVYLKGGMNLCTTGGVTVFQGANQDMNGCFVPLSNNWRTDTIRIPAIAGQSSVMFAFENRSGNGSNIFLDNINVPVNLGIVPVAAGNGKTEIFPNPNNGKFQLEIPMENLARKYQVQVYNMLGQEIYSKPFSTFHSQFSINLSAPPAGLYMYRVTDEQGNRVGEGKFVIAK